MFAQLLSATIEHLEELKTKGVRRVTVNPDNLQSLMQESTPQSSGIEHKPQMSPFTGKPQQKTDGREAAIEHLKTEIGQCAKCPHLAASRKNIVFGIGDIYSPLMFVGEAPGNDEDRAGEPFVGRAGTLLTKIIETMGLSRDKVFIGNILKCRPDTPGVEFGNRKPTADEMKQCLPFLLRQIEIIKPRVIVTLGATAMEGLFQRKVAITKERGHFLEFNGTPVMPTFHPAYVLRNNSIQTKRMVWEDMLMVMERLKLPISQKQRSFFT